MPFYIRTFPPILFYLCLLSLALLENAVTALICHQGYTKNGNICYDFNQRPLNWDQCNAYCTSQNSIMLCIQDSTQQNYVTSFSGGSEQLIGLYKTPGTNNLNWVAGCTSSYTNFAPGEGGATSEEGTMNFPSLGNRWADVPKTWGAQCHCQMNAFEVPTSQPSRQPSSQPSRQPSGQPNCMPTTQPSSQPFGNPTSQPSN